MELLHEESEAPKRLKSVVVAEIFKVVDKRLEDVRDVAVVVARYVCPLIVRAVAEAFESVVCPVARSVDV